MKIETIKTAAGAVQVVFVHAYNRFRLGKWEWVTSHYRSLPRT
jgi:hypothetical protein